MTESDAVLNPETRRALRKWGRRLSAVGAGALTALVMLVPPAVTAVRPTGVLFHLAVTLLSALALPIVTVYVAVRVYGLTHDEVLHVGRRALGTAIGAISTLGEHQHARRSDDERTETGNDPTTLITDSDRDEWW